MLSIIAPRVLNVFLRVMAMGSKFLLVVFLAKVLEPAEIGRYGLFAATIGFSMLIIGGDYYTYSNRELLSAPKHRWSFVIQHQALAIGLLYLVLLPSQLIFFWLGFLPQTLLVWFISLLLVEHIAQEINRLLIVMQRPLIASWILFIRLGLWVWALLPILWLYPALRNLETVFGAWWLGTSMAIIFGANIIRREVTPWRRWPLDRAWLMRGYKTGSMFLIATVCFKALQTIDRYVVEYLVGSDLLGVYVFYVSLAMAVVNLIDPMVFSFLYPRLVRAYAQGERETYRRLLKEMAWSAIGISAALSLVVALFAPLVFEWIGRPVYSKHLPLLWLLLITAVVYVAGMIPHYGLYAKKAEKAIMFAHVSSLLVFFAAVWLISAHDAFASAAYGSLAAFAWLGGVKLWHYHMLSKKSTKI